jgi:phosphate transport system permease protein
VVIPTARSGLATAVILGVARAIGEASPVLLTAGFTSYINANPLNGPMVSLPLETLKLVQAGVPAYTSRAFGAASFLLVVVVILFLVARRIGGWGPGHLSPRGQRRVQAASARDVTRFAQIGRSQYRRVVRSASPGVAPRTGGYQETGGYQQRGGTS